MHWILGCRFGARCRRGGGREFAVGPDGAVFEVLLLPDGNGALEGVNGEAAGVESGGAMGRADGDEDAGFADFEAAETMNDGHAVDAIFFVELGADFAHFGEGHGFVGFVIEIERGAVVGLVADETIEGDDGAVRGRAHVAAEGGEIDGLAHQLVDVVVDGFGHGSALAAAHGRKEGDFVAGMERRVPGGEFLVAGSDEGRAEFCELGTPGG